MDGKRPEDTREIVYKGDIKNLIQSLWTKATGQEGYDKREWDDLRFRVETLVNFTSEYHRHVVTHNHEWCPLCHALNICSGVE